jgi:tRNA dimethylallyltransferase
VRTDFLALLGPTASGKTALSLAVAPRIGGEIVSMDSRQVYRGMDIGTAKADAVARRAVPHHGLDLITPDQSYSAGRFARDARAWIQQLRARGRVPILVGGTGFFLRTLTEPIFREPPVEGERLAKLRAWLQGQPVERLLRWVWVLDPKRAPLAAVGGRQRLARTLEVALLSGRPLSEWHRRADPEGTPLAGPTVVLELPRAEMKRRIDARVQAMLEAGFPSEVEGLLRAGYDPSDPGMTATGYREIVKVLAGEWTLERAAAEIRRATRQYARRQLTWFRNQLGEGAVRLDATAPLEALVEEVVALWEGALNYPKGGEG